MPNGSIGERIKRARLTSGLTQAEVADRLGVSQMTVSNWERGRAAPRDPHVAVLEEFIGHVTPDEHGEPDERATDNEPSPFGAWVARLRSQRQLTRVELAGRARVTDVTVWNLETGRISNPHARTRERLIEALGARPPRDAIEETEREALIEDIGTLIDFDPHDREDLPAEPGIYVFYDVSERPIYIGASGDMRRRIQEHYDKFWFRHPIVTRGSYVSIPDERLRTQLERVLIRFLKSNAVINKQHVER